MIHARELTFSYGKRKIVNRLSFDAARGECIVFAGPNGSGKSTVLSLAAGILKAQSGSVSASGKIGYVPQGCALLEDATVEENLRFFAGIVHAAVPPSLPFGLEHFKNKKVSSLSGGMKKQVSIACALLGNPDVILLDEPCASLDISFRVELINLVLSLKARGRTVLYVGHDPLEFYPFFDKLIFMGEHPVTYEREVFCAANEIEFAEKFRGFFTTATKNINNLR